VLAPGTERAALSRVPLKALQWPEEMAATFARWGLTTLGDLAALPRQGLGTRLGAAGLAAHDLATGVDRAPFRPWTPPPFWEEAQGLDWEIATLPALMPVLQQVLDRLCARLAAAQLAIDALDLRLALVSGGHHARSVALAVPLDEAAPIAALLALEIEAHPPPAAVIGVALSARVVSRRPVPRRFGQPATPAPRDLAAVLARLSRLVGPANVGTPVVHDSHRPDDYTLAPFDGTEGEANTREHDAAVPSDDGASASAEPPTSAAAQLGLRRLRPPRRVEVETRDDRPVSVQSVAVVTSAGPWRLSGDWWDATPWARDEWDIELADTTVWRLTHDRLTNQWFLDALYD
jgi:protein ImuB